jgi:hypothetical protein
MVIGRPNEPVGFDFSPPLALAADERLAARRQGRYRLKAPRSVHRRRGETGRSGAWPGGAGDERPQDIFGKRRLLAAAKEVPDFA